jgi:hypothetical protein
VRTLSLTSIATLLLNSLRLSVPPTDLHSTLLWWAGRAEGEREQYTSDCAMTDNDQALFEAQQSVSEWLGTNVN